MALLNRPDKITLDAFSDPDLKFTGQNGVYSRFKNRLQTPILNVKGIQLLNANLINSSLQLNDNYSLMFFFYTNSVSAGNLRCIRLLPSNYVAPADYTSFTKNRYFNTVQELVDALNAAGIAGGDDGVFNRIWGENLVQFSYNPNTRRISVASISGDNDTICPAAADDPNVIDFLNNTGYYSAYPQRPTMNVFGGGGTYATSPVQPFVNGYSMNSRLGFAMSYYNTGRWWNGSSTRGCATSTGVFSAPADPPIEADANPILLGVQNVNVYLDIVVGSGLDSRTRKNLAGSVPIEVAPLNINSYTLSSVEQPLISCNNEIYEVNVELLDDNGQPFYSPPSFNTQLSFSLYYE